MKETGRFPIVSDHAVLRYLERCHGLNVEAIRAELRSTIETGVRFGTSAVICDNVKFVLREDTLVTVKLRSRS